MNKWLANNSFEQATPNTLEALDLRSQQSNFGAPSDVEILNVCQDNKPPSITNPGNFNYIQNNYYELSAAAYQPLNDELIDDKKNIVLGEILRQPGQDVLYQLQPPDQLQMTTDIHQAQSNRPIFKMNADFWQHTRCPPPLGGMPSAAVAALASNLMIQTTMTPTNLSAPTVTTASSATTGSSLSPSMSSGVNQGMVSPNSTNLGLHQQLLQQQHQVTVQQQAAANLGNTSHNLQAGDEMGGNPNTNMQLSLDQHQHQQQHQQQTQQQLPINAQQMNVLQGASGSEQPPQSLTPGGTSTSDSKMNAEKLVNEFQQLSRSNSAAAISERTLEECWSTLQRIFMHKSAMQIQQARDMHRTVGGNVGGLGAAAAAAAMGGDVKPHQCQQCLKSFSSNHQLVQHIRVHTGEKPYKCSYCDRRFKQLSHVQQHTRLHTGERPYKCHLSECGRAFIQLSNLQQHLRNHDAQVERAKNRPFHCNICGKGFATESSLRTHTSKELQLHLGVLQQHAALIGGPNATSCPICHKLFLGGEALMEHMKHTHKDPNASGVATKRRSANHPCPVCGKHYVNEGSLRKHLACHPETAQIATSLRMWPCSVCQAVFTHEAGLLTHMEHMRMDPKHQFAAQYVLSRAAAERRERDTILAAAAAVSASGSGLLAIGGGGQNSMCPSPSAQSDSSSGNERLSSTGSDAGTGLLNNNNNNNCSGKLSVNDVLRAGNNGNLHNQYAVDDLHTNRMAMMAAAAAGIVGQGGAGVTGGLGSPSVSDSNAAVQAAVVNLAAAMRMNQVANQQQQQQQQNVNNGSVNALNHGGNSPPMKSENITAAQAAMNAAMRASMADSMMSHHHNQQNSPEATLRMHQAEAILRSQAEAALRLAVSQAAAVAAGSASADVQANMRHHNGGNGSGYSNGNNAQQNSQQSQQQNSGNQQQPQQHPPQSLTPSQLQQQQIPNSTDLSEALRLQEQRLEQALRLHGGDPRALGFPLNQQQQQHQQHQQQQQQHQQQQQQVQHHQP